MKDTDIKFNQKNVVLKGDPCKMHEVEIMLYFTHEYGKEHGRTFLSSRITEYNNFNNKSSELELYKAYGGLFKEQFVENICLKYNWTVIIPEPPKSFKKCVKTNAGVQNISDDGTIPLEILDPKERGSFDNNFPLLTSIEKCQNRTETNPLATKSNPNTDDDAFQKLILTISVPIFVTVLLVLTGLVLKKKCSSEEKKRREAERRRREQRMMSIDENPTFGEYYDGTGTDRSSFDGGETRDNTPCYETERE